MKRVLSLPVLVGVVLVFPGIAAQATPAFDMTQTLSDGAQRATLAFSGLAMMTGNLDSQSFFPPGQVADYTGFQYLRDNDPDNMGHNTSFLTRVANNVLYILNDTQLEQLKTLASTQLDQINLYGYKRFSLMQAFRRLLEGDLPAGSAGLDPAAVKNASQELYLIDGQISFDRALLYANIYSSMSSAQTSYLDAMKGLGWNSWPNITDDQVRSRLQGLSQGMAVAVMTYAGDLFSWYAGSLDADVYFCPERQGTYFGSFYIKDAPAIGHEGYSIDQQLTATAGAALCDSSKGYVTQAQAALISGLVDTQRNNLYAGAVSIVGVRTQIATLLRSLLVSTASSDSVKTQVLALSATYGDLDGENNYHYATVFAQVYQSLTADQKTQIAALRHTIMSGTYPDGTAFDYTLSTTPFLYSGVITDTSLLTPYIGNTDYLFLIETAPAAAFTFSPAAPVAGQSVTFTDSSTNTPTSWSWDFGDGTTSTAQNPAHVYSAAGTYTVTLVAGNAGGSGTVSQTVTASPATTITPFDGNLVLGRPTATSIAANIFSPDQNGTALIEYGLAPGALSLQSAAGALQAATPLVLSLSGLSPNAQYHYRLNFLAAGESAHTYSAEHAFHTARPADTTFTFTIQADSHLDDQSNLDLYRRTLANVVSDAPDFHMDLGDTFMCEKHSAPLTALVLPAADPATVNARYVYERANFGIVGCATPLFLVNGNHEGEAGWFRDGTANNLAIWTTQARQKYYVNPVPDTFYSGDSTEETYVGKRAAWYSWNWGNALFIVLDPFWNSPKQPGSDGWNLTLGQTQYRWLQSTLASSSATFKFVFVHNLVGGLDGQMRGGIEAAPFFEWGGRDLDGTDVFAQERSGWSKPIHQLLVQYGVTAVFHGHDHLYDKQDLDGVVYQEVPQPSASNFQSGPGLASDYHYAAGTILSSSGHLRVTVGPGHITSQYVRAWLPANENTQRKNGQVAHEWTVAAPGWPTAAFSFSPTAPQIGGGVVFTDISTGSPTAWSWDFGDGTASSTQNPSHSYSTTGTYTVSLTASNAAGSHTATQTVVVSPLGTVPTAAFTFAPAAPANGQTVLFTDASTGSPTTWQWNFGDGVKSTLQNPGHAYAATGTYTVSLKASNTTGVNTVKHTVTVTPAGNSAISSVNIVLGNPTAASVKANVFTAGQGGTVYIAYGTASGVYGSQTAQATLQTATPVEIALDGLNANTQYYYRLYYQAAGETGYSNTDEYSFHTARPAGSTYAFCIQGDSHPERLNSQFNPDLYSRTLLTAAADQPDFYLAMGDDFSVDQLDPLTVTAAQVVERYTIQRPFLGLIGRTAPVFLVNGNHEQAARYLLNGTADNVAVWAQNARNSLYSQPAPDSFYSGDTENVPYIGLLRNFYAWTWGDALFVTIDPYWASPTCVDDPFDGSPKRTNLWDITHGDAQYQWLKTTLEQSHAQYKFVFAHHVMGTGRGGTDVAGQYEWGGQNSNGTWGFTANRPAWPVPIHQLMADNKVTIFFQGHDHIWVRQQLDGVVYQTLPEPADPNYVLYNSDAYETGDKFANTGYTRVVVSPLQVRVDYVRTCLPADEGPGNVNGSTVFGYSISPAASAPMAAFTFSPSAPIAGETVYFTDSSTNAPASWSWDFGDDTSGTDQNPAHAYAASGTYTVTLTAANAGGSTVATRTIDVAVPPPAAAFAFSPSAPVAGQAVNFTDASTNTPTSWSWDFGDSAASTDQNPTHTYAASGMYTVTLTARNAGGYNAATRSVNVTVPAPVAAFTFTPPAPVAGQTVSFSDTSTNTPTSWSWDFGDGASSTDQNPTHIYAAASAYTVTLTAGNAGGHAVATHSISVSVPAPLASFTFLPPAPVAGQPVSFTDTSTNAPTFWTWDFGDGTGSSDQNPTHVYAATGTHTVTLAAGNSGGVSAAGSLITIGSVPSTLSVQFSASPTMGSTPLKVQFNATVSGTSETVSDWYWDFGDGTNVSVNVPDTLHTYTETGAYTVSLTATTPSDSATITLKELIVANQTVSLNRPGLCAGLAACLLAAGTALLGRHRPAKRD